MEVEQKEPQAACEEAQVEETNPDAFEMQFRYNKATIFEGQITSEDFLFEYRDYTDQVIELFFIHSFHFQYSGKKIDE